MGQCRSKLCVWGKAPSDDATKRPRRNSGLFLIEAKEAVVPPPRSKLDKKRSKHRKGKYSKKNIQVKKNEEMSDDSKIFIRKTLLRSGAFNDEVSKRNICSRDIDKIVLAFQEEHLEDGQTLFRKDDFPSDKLYIVRRGIFRGMDGNMCKAIMREKDMMGELCFFHYSPRVLSVIAGGTQPSAFSLTKRDFKAIVEKGRDLNNIKIFDPLSEAQKYLVKDRVTIHNFHRGDNILRKGSPIDFFYVVLCGQILVTGGSEEGGITPFSPAGIALHIHDISPIIDKPAIAFINPGDYLGDEKFVANIERSSKSYTAANEVTVCAVSRQLFDDESVFGPAKAFITADIGTQKEVNAIRNVRRRKSLVKFSSFNSLPEEGTTKTEDNMSLKSSAAGTSKRRRSSIKKSDADQDIEDWTKSPEIKDRDDLLATVFCGYDLSSCGLNH